MQNRLHHRLPDSRGLRSGFTLVEMLVAVALVLLMMSLFAEIFSLATGSMSRQKGVSENDQRARMVLTLLKGDLEKRTFRDVVPFVPGTTTNSIPYISQAMPNRRGYICYSENNPADETDDTLRLTIDVNMVTQNTDVTPLYGRATAVGGAAGLQANPNQPDGDDGEFPLLPSLLPAPNNTGMSDAAEVVYFLRDRRLYRRQMLIRNPYIGGASSNPTTGSPPTATPLFGSTYTFGSQIFWQDFDYSVFYDQQNNQLRFHDNASLNNISNAPAFNLGGGFTVPVSLGVPHLRFGHTILVTSGIPKEFLGADNAGLASFIGCFTHEETSSSGFLDPGQSTTASTNPHARTNLTFDTVTPGIDAFTVNEYRDGTRIGEDLLLTNVLSFDIKIWDPGVSMGPDGLPGDGLNHPPGSSNGDDNGDGTINNPVERGWKNSDDGDWRDLGHDEPQGYYFRVAGATNGNGTAYGNRFDTWHPTTALTELPPYRASYYYPTGSVGATNHSWRGRDNWTASNPQAVGDVIFPPNAIAVAQGFTFAYRCRAVGAVTQLTSPVAPVAWPTVVGDLLQDADVTWECVENTIPVKGLQFKIRYLDISSGLVRDLTFVQYLNIPN